MAFVFTVLIWWEGGVESKPKTNLKKRKNNVSN
jgi:hypothetical protein